MRRLCGVSPLRLSLHQPYPHVQVRFLGGPAVFPWLRFHILDAQLHSRRTRKTGTVMLPTKV